MAAYFEALFSAGPRSTMLTVFLAALTLYFVRFAHHEINYHGGITPAYAAQAPGFVPQLLLFSFVVLYTVAPDFVRYWTTYLFWDINAAHKREQEQKARAVPERLLQEAAMAGAAAALSASQLGEKKTGA